MDEKKKCVVCKGKGYIVIVDMGVFANNEKCGVCKGTGFVKDELEEKLFRKEIYKKQGDY